MSTMGLKGTISDSERKAVLFIGMVSLLSGMAVLGAPFTGDQFAPLAIMVGLFGICIGAVKRKA